MIKREFNVNFKSFIIWTSILLLMFLVVFLIYPYIITDDKIQDLNSMMEVFPKELLKAFNMDLASINSAYGWLKSEGFMFILIVIGIYSSVIGSTIVLKEENDKTIEYLVSLPVKRSTIMTHKIIVSITYILLMILIIGLFNYIALLISGNFNKLEYLLLSISPILIALPLFAINLFISTFLHKTKKTLGISMGLVLIFYLLNILSELSKTVEFLKFFSIYTLASVRNIITNTCIDISCIIISIIITCIFIILSYIRYNKKELV